MGISSLTDRQTSCTLGGELVALYRETGIPGLSAAVVTDTAECLYLGKMGEVTPYDREEVREGMIYDLASLTKVVGTTTRLFQLVEEGRLDFNTPIREILSDLPNLTMTLEDVMLHRAGFISDFEDHSLFSEEVLRNYLRDFSYKGPQKAVYSDIGFLLLGFLIEEIDQTDLDTSFREHIFHPLNMKDTGYFPKELGRIVPTEVTQTRGVIAGVVHDGKAFKLGRPAGHAGLFSTLEDLVIFIEAIQNRTLFSDEIASLLEESIDGRARGWEKPFGDSVIYHTGFTGPSLGIDLKSNRGLIILTNRIHPDRTDRGFIRARNNLYQKFFGE